MSCRAALRSICCTQGYWKYESGHGLFNGTAIELTVKVFQQEEYYTLPHTSVLHLLFKYNWSNLKKSL